MASMIQPIGGLAKPRTWRSDKYQGFVRMQPCLACGRPAYEGDRNTFHHIRLPGSAGGQSCKPSDTQGISLCPICHTEHQNNLDGLLQALDWDMITLTIHMLKQLDRWLGGR